MAYKKRRAWNREKTRRSDCEMIDRRRDWIYYADELRAVSRTEFKVR